MVTRREGAGERRDKQICREHSGGEDEEDTKVIVIYAPFCLEEGLLGTHGLYQFDTELKKKVLDDHMCITWLKVGLENKSLNSNEKCQSCYSNYFCRMEYRLLLSFSSFLSPLQIHGN